MMKTILLVAVLAAVTLAAKPKWHQLRADYSFEKYKSDFDKSYKGAEHDMREKLFKQRLAAVMTHNSEKHSWKKGINHMSDWTEAERSALRGNLPRGKFANSLGKHRTEFKATGAPLPASVDYRTNFPPVLSAVKDQGHCGSCWAHASAEELESMYALATGELYTLSQQQLTSCVKNPNDCGGTGGCSGATAELAFDYVTANGGITQEWMMGYESYFGDVPKCAYNASKTKPVVKISGYTGLPRNDAGPLMEAIARAGPLAISVAADQWPDYEAGVFTGCNYAKNITMDHAVQVVGYGTDAALGVDYWLVRNSWSPAWGEAGFIRLFKEREGAQCGWNNDWVTMGGGCKGEPNTVWACGQCGILYDTLYPNVIVN